MAHDPAPGLLLQVGSQDTGPEKKIHIVPNQDAICARWTSTAGDTGAPVCPASFHRMPVGWHGHVTLGVEARSHAALSPASLSPVVPDEGEGCGAL